MCSKAKRVRFEDCEPTVIQEIPGEKLCDDVLVEIFSYLSVKDMKSATLVCKQWNEVIGSSAATMRKFKLVVGRKPKTEPDGTIRSVTEALENFKRAYLAVNLGSTRKHQNIRINDSSMAVQATERFDFSHAKFFKFYSFRNVADISRLLSLMPQLEDLHIGDRFAFSNQGPKVDLPKLKKMVVKSNNGSIYNLITCDNLVELEHRLERVKEQETNHQSLVDFLGRCKKLKNLRLGSEALAEFLEANDPKRTGWQLSTFRMYFTKSPDEAFVTNLENFLISQASTLTTLKFEKLINQNIILPTEFYKNVFSVATKLTKFRNKCDTVFFWYHGESLRSLSALEELQVDARVHDLDSIAALHPKLTFLKVKSVPNSFDTELKFSNLIHLGVAFLGGADADAWISLIAKCPKIESFALKHFSGHVGKDLEDYLNVIKALVKRPTIRHLKFLSDKNDQLEAFFMTIGKNCGNLTRLTLYRINDQHMSIEFSLPLWNFVEETKRFRGFIGAQCRGFQNV